MADIFSALFVVVFRETSTIERQLPHGFTGTARAVQWMNSKIPIRDLYDEVRINDLGSFFTGSFEMQNDDSQIHDKSNSAYKWLVLF